MAHHKITTTLDDRQVQQRCETDGTLWLRPACLPTAKQGDTIELENAEGIYIGAIVDVDHHGEGCAYDCVMAELGRPHLHIDLT